MTDYRHSIQNLAGKTIILGVTGGIAAYKSTEIVRLLRRKGACVWVVMTQNAAKLIGPITFQALSDHPVAMDLWAPIGNQGFNHIHYADLADAILVAPATANMIAKYANGVADDLLSTLLISTSAPILMAPAMNPKMYEHPSTQANLEILSKRGVVIIGPGEGEVACGHVGKGRMSEPDTIVDHASRVLGGRDFAGKKILITAGPTREPIDPVRYISNRSSGLMGFCLAAAAAERGAEVVVIAGPSSIPKHAVPQYISVSTAAEMKTRLEEQSPNADIIIMAAAVADWRPVEVSSEKIKKNSMPETLTLVRNPDLLKELAQFKSPGQIIVGFAAETRDIEQEAMRKLKEKNLDLIFANDVSREDSGFEIDTNSGYLLDKNGSKTQLPVDLKRILAERLLDKIAELMKNQT